MRITTNAILRGYKSNLASSISNLNSARNKVMTQRSFNSVAEDPASASREASLLRKYAKNNDNLDMLKDMQSRQDSQEDALRQVSDILTTIGKTYGLEAMNATNQELNIRQTYAAAIRKYQETMVASLNATYEGTFLFSGTDGANAPFSLNTDTNTLEYLGHNVDVSSAADPLEFKELDDLAKESLYVDMGFGLSMDKSATIDSSNAYDMSLPGIKAVGYGKDDGGLSNNAIVLAGELARLLEEPAFNADEYKKTLTKFESSSSGVLNQVTQLGVKTEFLTATKERLDNSSISIQTQLQNVSGIDPADAITNYSWNQYTYEAALKVGTSILSSSLLDFLD